jgi:hypothetical protein
VKSIKETGTLKGAYLVCKGALCKCSAGAVSVSLDITTHSNVYINDAQASKKLVATEKDVNFIPKVQPFQSCKLNPSSDKLCKYQASGQWIMDGINTAEHPEVAGDLVLTENAKLKCPVFPQGEITFVTHGQTVSAGDETPETDPAILLSVNCLAQPEATDESKKEKKKKKKGWCSSKYANLDKAKIDIKESEIESFEMVDQFLGETAGFTESPPDTMSQSAVIAFYANGIFLSDKMVFILECSYKAIPIIGGNTSITYA